MKFMGKVDLFLRLKFRIVDAQERTLLVANQARNMRNKSCGNGSKNCVAFRNVMRNGIAIGNPSLNPGIWPKVVKHSCRKNTFKVMFDE